MLKSVYYLSTGSLYFMFNSLSSFLTILFPSLVIALAVSSSYGKNLIIILNTHLFKYNIESAVFESDTVDVHPPGKSLMIELYCFFSRFDENRRTDLKESVSDE